jgi:UDP-N-acetylglucosamine--N-acetylmuramyl-(pentapeptide) pyrophosphoryl-undecaprenol N-acetylglucosamine transferase
MTIGIAAAGTGGHVFPALAVADVLTDRGVDPADIVFFGGDRLEAVEIPAAGYTLVAVEQRGFVRRFSFENVRVAGLVLAAAKSVRREIKRRDIAAMLAMGGYITGPAALAARWTRIPLLLHEQNAEPGVANRWAGRLAERVFVAFPAAATRLAGAEVVGNPLRMTLVADPPPVAEARVRYGLDLNRPVVGVLGGSQGADALNRAAHRLARELPAFQLLHLAGPTQHEAWTKLSAEVPDWHVVPFEADMSYFYAAVDLVIARAGALTVSELAATATPSILVPYPGATGHQEANARYLADNGGAVILPQSELNRLKNEIAVAMTPGELARRGAAAGVLGKPDAAEQVAKALQEAARA